MPLRLRAQGAQRFNPKEEYVELSANRRAKVYDFDGYKMLDLREYYEKDGQVNVNLLRGAEVNLCHDSRYD